MKIALIGKGPSRAAYQFGDSVCVDMVNSFFISPSIGGHDCCLCSTTDHISDIERELPAGHRLFAIVLIERDSAGRRVRGHAAPRILRAWLSYPDVTRIYLQGFDLSEPRYTCQLREFAKIARIPGARDRIIVTTPGPLDKYFVCRAPDPEDLADVG